MAKVIKYKFLSCEVNHGTEENPDIEQIFLDMDIICKTQAEYDANLPIAEREAFPGTLDPDVDGVFDEETVEPTQLDIIEAQVAYTAMMTDTLLEV